MKPKAILILAAVAVAACSDDGPLAPELAPIEELTETPSLDVLTWNVYVGARLSDLLPVQDPNQIPFEVANIIGQVVANDFDQRADAIAEQVARANPDVISLQEISLFRTQSPGDFLVGNPAPAETPFLDYLAILHGALVDRGLRYDVVSMSENFDFELPMVNFQTGGLDDVRLTDFDVILVRQGIPYENAMDGNFAAALPIQVGGAALSKPSGWASIDVRVAGRQFRVLNTHLEAADIGGALDPQLAALQAAQLGELMGIMAGSPHDVVLTGDLNSAADGSSTTSYADLIAAGFLDAWSFGTAGSGFTSNQAPDLRNAASQLFHRIDFVLAQGIDGSPSYGPVGEVTADRVGEEQADRTVGGLWPSDHAGVFATFPVAGQSAGS